MVDFDVVDLGDAAHVAEGETAPDFTRPLVDDEYWEDVALSELTAEGPVLLVFYTMDGAFPATYVWNEIRDRGWGERLTVVGVSISTPYEHGTLIEERGMDYRLFSDPANGVAREYGIGHELDGMTGVSEPRPAVFLLDEDRTVRYAWVAREWPEFPDYDEVEEAIEREV
ncbi:redoxin domain-containing protein [Halegenticoccus tardaugens]|uniref:redoxin domain-containing protein n=1 Tax=Halegenticoccus tardaugens TaxID=2071624 RepID=UPI00100AEA71|nr:redoxin domain-containing protein [Halegenticoccus tardaugens]